MTCVNLKPNLNLLDCSFESYKLSLEQLPIYSVKLDTGPDVVNSKTEDFSYQRTKLLTTYNYLTPDPWNDRTCYYVDPNGRVKQACVSIETSIPKPCTVFQLDHYSFGDTRILPVSMSFPSNDLCLFVNDVGQCSLVNTGNRNLLEKVKWRTIFECSLVEDELCRVVILQSRQRNHDSSNTIDMVILKFHDKESGTSIYTEWVSFVNDNERWSVGKKWLFKGSHIPFFVGFGKNSETIHIGSQSKVAIVPNWEAEISKSDVNISEGCGRTMYCWKQSDEDITINIQLTEEITKESVVCKVETDNVEISIKSNQTVESLLKGELFDSVDTDLSSWTLSKNVLEIILQKKAEGRRWEYVLQGDTSQELHDDVTMTEVRGFQPTGLDKYEDCDDLPDASSVLYCFNGVLEKFTYEASLASNQWLFNCYHEQQYCTVLRHDVDALMWTCDPPHNNLECPWLHIATFNALGYVKASKQDVKYASSATNATYAALCESARRVFVYHTCTAASAPLRNRVTGKQAHLSKQQVVTLPSNAPIYGFHTADDVIFVLTSEELHVVKMYVPQS